ncbi:MAG: hypothetical protein JRD89_20825 [Deltaproteobacteria bacterium]|nr:hypothetical protein [Deltaproteobacteria bacterium]
MGIRERIEEEVRERVGPAVAEMKRLEAILKELNESVKTLNKNIVELNKNLRRRGKG